MDIDNRPDWLKKYANGLQGGYRYKVFLDGVKFGIIHCPGHMAYLNRFDGCKYYQTEYILIEKGTGYWDHRNKEVWQGRMNSNVKASLVELLERYESGELKFKS